MNKLTFFFVVFLGLSNVLLATAPSAPTGLMTELLSQPEKTQITDNTPEFSWEVNDVDKFEMQTAYQIIVDSSIDDINSNKGVLWNSGKINSSTSTAVSYAGTNLASSTTYYWKVKTWDKDGNESPFSTVQSFNTTGEKPIFELKNATITNDQLVLNNAAFVNSVYTTPWANLTLELNAIIKTNALGLNFRMKDATNYYMWQISSKEQLLKMHKCVNGSFSVVKSVAFAFQNDVVYNVKIETNGPTIKTYINNVLIDEMTDNTFTQGSIGFRQGTTESAIVDNIVLKSETSTLLTENFNYKEWKQPDYYKVESELIAPHTFLNKGGGNYFIDFGKAAFGRVVVTLTGNAGQSVVVKIGESKSGDQVNATPPNTNVLYYTTTINLLQGTNKYEVNTGTQAQGFSDVLFNTRPFRYCELSGVPQTFVKEDINQEAVFYPFDENAASFQSSNSNLNKIWELCNYTMKATSWLGIYVDGNRERKPYEADAYIQQLGHYSLDKEAYSIARRSHEYLIKHATWPTEWTPHSVLMAYSDWMWTGDNGSIIKYYTDLKAKTQHALTTPNNLISTATGLVTTEFKNSIYYSAADTYRDIVDWPTGERDGYDFKDYNTVVNAIHHGAMTRFKVIADSLKKSSDSEYFNTKISNNKTAFNSLLWDNTNKRYVDGIGTTHAALHASMFAVAFDLADNTRKKDVAPFLASHELDCSVYGAQYFLESLYKAELGQKALNIMTSTASRSWNNMIQEGSTVAMESWGQAYKPNQDWNHAWGAAPANIIPQYLMGVQPLTPGFSTFQIKPQTGNLTSASLKMPTVKGTINVAIENNNSTYKIIAKIPVNTTANIYIPAFNTSSNYVLLNNTSTLGRREGDFIVLDNIGSGEHTIIRENIGSEAPLVSFTIANNSSYSAPANLTVEVQAVNNVSLASVKLYVNDTFLGEKLTAPYTWGGRTAPKLQNMPAGNYTLKAIARDVAGNISETSINIIVLSPAGVSEITQSMFKLYPNPATHELNIRPTDIVFENAEVAIYNTIGEKVISQPISGSHSKINIKHLPVGVYIIKLMQNEKMYLERFIKK